MCFFEERLRFLDCAAAGLVHEEDESTAAGGNIVNISSILGRYEWAGTSSTSPSFRGLYTILADMDIDNTRLPGQACRGSRERTQQETGSASTPFAPVSS